MIPTDKIEKYAVTTIKIANGAVTEDKIADGAVTSDKIAAGTIVTAHIAAGAVDRDHLSGGFSKLTIADGTASATDVTVSGMAVGDELVGVLALTTKASIATLADRTSEYVVGAGKLVKAAGTDESSNQLLIYWNDLT